MLKRGNMANHLVSFDDLSVESIEKIFSLADFYYDKLKKKEAIDICKDKIMVTMFYEPSTRTRMSFESAMFRLGGKVISSADTQGTSSAVKGESLSDTIKVVQNYADIIVLRHFVDGSTVLASEYSEVPIISGGDGKHEHPTQTLCDLYTIKKLKGEIAGKNVALFGDLKHGRTVHSLAYGLAKFGAKIFCVAPEGFEIPEYVIHRVKSEYNVDIKQFSKLDEPLSDQDVLYMSGETEFKNLKKKTGKPVQLAFSQTIEFLDALYVTRVQVERIKDKDFQWSNIVDAVNKDLLKKAKDNTIVMHPLPRRDELSYDIDQDRRAAYFKQAEYGVPIRMALIVALLGLADFELKMQPKGKTRIFDTVCTNSNCITNKQNHIEHKFTKANGIPWLYRCSYCDQEHVIRHNVEHDEKTNNTIEPHH